MAENKHRLVRLSMLHYTWYCQMEVRRRSDGGQDVVEIQVSLRCRFKISSRSDAAYAKSKFNNMI